jgi:hypothetical protein
VCATGLVIADLGLPSQGGVDSATISDANDHGVIVGMAYKAAAPWEPYAARWYRDNGTWVAEDLNELNATGGYLIDSCLAVNDAGYIIATGHLDGTDVFHNRTLLLVPDKVPTPSVVTLSATDLTPTSATLWAKVNACTKSTTPAFHFGNTAAYGQSFPAPEGAVTGMAPALRGVALTNLTPNTTYHFRGTAVSSKGTTHGDDFAFTTPHNLDSWTTLMFGPLAGNPAIAAPDVDYDHDGESNFAEYAFGHDPAVADSEATPYALEPAGFCITYSRPTDHAGVAYAVEVATDLAGPWNSGPGFTEDVNVILSGNSEMVKARSVLSTTTYPRQFLRVRVAQVP